MNLEYDVKYKLRPSGASRWLACPASLVLEERVPVVKRNDMIPAYLGSATHELLEKCIKEEKSPEKFRGESIEVFDEEAMDFPYTISVNQKMIDTVNFFLSEVGIPAKDSEVYSELKMEHSEIPELRGTADYVCVSGTHALLADLKNGRSVVQVKNRKGEVNPQLLCYACLLKDRFPDIETITIAVIQPNGTTKLKTRSTGLDIDAVKKHLYRVKQTAKIADEVSEDRMEAIAKEGSHCFWCRAKNICAVRGRKELNRDFGE